MSFNTLRSFVLTAPVRSSPDKQTDEPDSEVWYGVGLETKINRLHLNEGTNEKLDGVLRALQSIEGTQPKDLLKLFQSC